MDYEKKYNEALERVRRLHDRMLVLSSTDALVASSELEFIFPELAESDDERIREWLVYYFKAIGKSWLHHRDISIEQILAYLEKQKEQKKKNVLIWGEPQVTITVQKPEWSEDDELMMKAVIGILDERDHPKLCHWLKSRRPSWKPSEEQMKALEAATVRYQSTGLESLYEDLKKL